MKVRLVFGPPGTGKTTRLLQILDEELRICSTSEVAYVSFTKEGAYQGRDRALLTFSKSERDFPYFRTLHSIAFRALGLSRSQIIDRGDYREFSDKMGMKFTGYYTEELHHNDDRYLFFNILHRNNPRVASQYLHDLDTQKLRFVTNNYRRFKEQRGLLDFTDMIERFCERARPLPVRVAIIDEAQDLTTLQWRMIWTAFRDCERIYVAGDDDQAIYEWSGADVEYFLRVEGEIEILRQSWRIPNNIVQFVTRRVISMIGRRVSKEYQGLDRAGRIVRLRSVGEVEIDQSQTWMFLSRNHCFLTEVTRFLRDQGVVYEYCGELSVSKHELEMIRQYETGRREGAVSDSVRPFLRRDFDPSQAWYDSFKWDDDKLRYYRDVIRARSDPDKCVVRVSTIHAVKGAEADNVVVMMDVTRQIYSNMHENPDSEYRVLYVGLTRVKRSLFIVDASSRFEYPLAESEDMWTIARD